MFGWFKRKKHPYSEKELADMFYDAQRKFDRAISDRNLASWMGIINRRMAVVHNVELTNGWDIFKDSYQISKEVLMIMYDNWASVDMGLKDLRTQLHSYNLMMEEAHVYSQEVMRINKLREGKEGMLGPNQSRFMLFLSACIMTTQQRIDDIEDGVERDYSDELRKYLK